MARLAVVSVAVGVVLVAGLGAHAPASGTPPPPRATISGWIPYWSHEAADAQLEASAGGALDELNPFGWSLLEDGTLEAKGIVADPARLAELRATGALLLPTVFDVDEADALDAVLDDPEAQDQALESILEAVERDQLDGVDLDLEHATAETRQALVRFVTRIGRALRQRGKLCSVTLPPKRGETTWAGYDYAGLGAAADRVKIMGYGVSGRWSKPGPTGPVGFLRQVAAYARSHIPAAKLHMGISLYGIDWSDEGGVKNLVSQDAIDERLARSSHGARWDEASGESHFRYRDDDGVGHTVWFTEPRGVARKAQLVREEGLAGLALWAVGYARQEHIDRAAATLHPPGLDRLPPTQAGPPPPIGPPQRRGLLGALEPR